MSGFDSERDFFAAVTERRNPIVTRPPVGALTLSQVVEQTCTEPAA